MAFAAGKLDAAPKSSDKAITSFTIAGAADSIDGTAIAVDLTTLPLFTRVDALVATGQLTRCRVYASSLSTWFSPRYLQGD